MVPFIGSRRKIHQILLLPSPMENHHHHSQPESEPLLEAFQADLSSSLDRLLSPDSLFPSLSWTKHCFGILHSMKAAFTKIAVQMDHPVNGWDADLVEGYLTYSLNLLDLLNSISSSLSQLAQSRLSLSLALTVLHDSPPPSAADGPALILPREAQLKQLRTEEETEMERERVARRGKEMVLHKALRLMEGVGYWLCGAALSALSGDPKAYLEMRRRAIGSENSLLLRADSYVHEVILQKQKGCALREVEEINESVACLLALAAVQEEEGKPAAAAAAAAEEELQIKLQGFEKLIEEISEEVDRLFSEILKSRNEVIDCLRIT